MHCTAVLVLKCLHQLLPPPAYPDNPSTSILSKYVHTSTNKVRCPINVVRVSLTAVFKSWTAEELA